MFSTLHEDAKAHLPKGTYYEIRSQKLIDHVQLVAWYCAPKMEERLNQPQHYLNDRHGTCLFIGGYYS